MLLNEPEVSPHVAICRADLAGVDLLDVQVHVGCYMLLTRAL